MTTRIRQMTPEDKPSIMQILTNTPEFRPSEVIVAEEVIDSYLEDPSGSGYHTFVAAIDDSIAGYICYGPTPLTEGTWDIYWMAVTPELQGRGIGKILITFAEDKIRQAEGRLAIIETSSIPEYERTRGFFYSRGYELVCRIADFYLPGDDKLIFRKKLKKSSFQL
jgi:predicted N-acetyltransferase YhbS